MRVSIKEGETSSADSNPWGGASKRKRKRQPGGKTRRLGTPKAIFPCHPAKWQERGQHKKKKRGENWKKKKREKKNKQTTHPTGVPKTETINRGVPGQEKSKGTSETVFRLKPFLKKGRSRANEERLILQSHKKGLKKKKKIGDKKRGNIKQSPSVLSKNLF